MSDALVNLTVSYDVPFQLARQVKFDEAEFCIHVLMIVYLNKIKLYDLWLRFSIILCRNSK